MKRGVESSEKKGYKKVGKKLQTAIVGSPSVTLRFFIVRLNIVRCSHGPKRARFWGSYTYHSLIRSPESSSLRLIPNQIMMMLPQVWRSDGGQATYGRRCAGWLSISVCSSQL